MGLTPWQWRPGCPQSTQPPSPHPELPGPPPVNYAAARTQKPPFAPQNEPKLGGLGPKIGPKKRDLTPKCPKVGPQINQWSPKDPKMHPNGPPMDPKWTQNGLKWTQNGQNWGFGPQNRPQKGRSDPKVSQSGTPKLSMVSKGPQNAPKWTPKWTPNGPQMDPKLSKIDPKWPKLGVWAPKSAPKREI